jgi:hypothetical protein
MFYEAGALIIQQVTTILAGYVAEYHADMFACVHTEIGEIEDLINEAKRFEKDAYSDLDACQKWMEKVASYIPVLWD